MKLFDRQRMAKAFCECLSLVLLFTALLDARANPLESWTHRFPTQLGPLNSRIIHGNGVYVSVGGGGEIRISSDLTNWVAVPVPTTANLSAVTYGNGLFAAVGSAGTVLISSNGANWTLQNVGTNATLESIIFANGKFVTVGNYYSAISSNGETWTSAPSPPDGLNIDITYGNGVFVTATYDGSMWSSEDGLSWSRGSGFSRSGSKQVAFGNGVFVVAPFDAGSASFYTSVDGATWSRGSSSLNASFSTICFGNGVFVGSAGQFISSDGTNWFATGTGAVGNLSFANGQFLAASAQFRISRDALTWRTIQYPSPLLQAITHADGAFIILGSISARSTNGTDWMIGSTATRNVNGLAYGNGVHVADADQVLTSPDGLTWTVPDPNAPHPRGGVAFGNGWFVIYDQYDSVLKRSRDGTNWQVAVGLPFHMEGIAFGNGRFVVATRDADWRVGTVLISSNAIDWSTNSMGADVSAGISISFANGLFFVRASSTTAGRASYTSADGLNWTGHSIGHDGAPGDRIIFCNGLFVSPGDRGRMLVSSNGADWSAVQGQYSSSIVGLATDGQTAVGVTRREILQSEPFSPTAAAILIHPKDSAVPTSAAAVLNVSAYGSLPLLYQWLKDGVLLNGETNAQLVLREVQSADAGSYSVLVSNRLGSVTSDSSVVTVLPPPPPAPVITTQPQGRASTVGQTVYFAVVVDGAPTLHYQWSKDGEPIAGATNSTFLFRILSEAGAGNYSVAVSNNRGTATSDVAALSVSQPPYPLILSQPQALTVTNGGTAVFDVEAAGAAPLRYQWRISSSAIAGATNRTLTLTNVQPSQAGQYSVVVSNAVTSVPSLPAALTVYSPPSLIEQPKSVNVAAGAPLILRSWESSLGVPWAQAQWLKDGQAIPLATNRTYTNLAARMSDAGSYQIVLSNIVSRVVSEPALVRVFPQSPVDRWSAGAGLSPSLSIRNVVYAEGLFVAVGSQLWAISCNGADWSEFNTETPADVVLLDVTYGGGQFVAVGGSSRIAFTYPGFPDALAFTTAPGLNHLVGVTYGGGTFVAVGDRGIILSSVNGGDWITRTNLQVTLTDVAYGAGRFVAVGPGSWLVTSTDGITWIPLNVPGFTNRYHVGVAYGLGVGSPGTELEFAL